MTFTHFMHVQIEFYPSKGKVATNLENIRPKEGIKMDFDAIHVHEWNLGSSENIYSPHTQNKNYVDAC